MSSPTPSARPPTEGASSMDSPTPTASVTKGVTRMSTLVSLDTALPHSAATTVMSSTASGPPEPPSTLALAPTVTMEKSTKGGACSASAMATAMAAPTTSVVLAKAPTCTKKSMPSCWPSVSKMVPISSDANRPCAMAPSASMP